MNKHIVVSSDASFRADVLESPLPVLVDFWAPWCGPCRVVGPVVEELAEEFAGSFNFVKLNTEEQMETAAAYGIRSIPNLAIFRDGKVVDGILGAAPKSMLKELIEKHRVPVTTSN